MHYRRGLNLQSHSSSFKSCQSSCEASTDKSSMYEKNCEWLLNRKNVRPVKIEDMDLNRQDFCKARETAKRLLTAPKKNHDPLVQPQKRPLDFHDFADKLKDIIPGSVLNTAVPKSKLDFVRELFSSNEQTVSIPILKITSFNKHMQ